MQSGGDRYGMGTTGMQAYLPSPTTSGGGGATSGTRAAGTRSLSHLFGLPPQSSSDITGLHRTSSSLHHQQQQHVEMDQHYLEQLSQQHQLALRAGSAAHQAVAAGRLSPFLQTGSTGLQQPAAHNSSNSMASFFKTAQAAGVGGLSGHSEAPDTISSHSFFDMAPGQEQFKLAYGSNQQQQQLANHGAEERMSAMWRADETAALLKLCSDGDPYSPAISFWDDVARKLQGLGYQRSPHTCKEKFESFHTRYKKGREENQRRELEFSSDFSSEGAQGGGHALNGGHAAPNQLQPSENNLDDEDEEDDDDDNNDSSKKRKLDALPNSSFVPSKSFFERLTREIIEKQEELHRTFLETIERKDRERVLREEAHRRQEAARLEREQELRAQEVSIAASRDAALITFLEKVTGQSLSTLPKIGILTHSVSPLSTNPSSASAAAASMAAALMQQQPSSSEHQLLQHHQAFQDASDMDNSSDINTKRWPKVEVHALIRLRSGMEPRFREAGPKAHLWQEISTSMACLGFIRSPKRCKEKWENINKYFKKTKDSSKKRPENAKTCPYFHQLDTLYQRGILTSSSSGSTGKLLGKPDNLLEYNTQDEDEGLNMQNSAENGQGDIEGSSGEMQNSEKQPAKDKEIRNEQVSMLDVSQNSLFASTIFSNNPSNQSSAGATSMISVPQQMHKFLPCHGLNMNAATKKSLQVEMFVKDILDLQQQQHQKLVEEYDRMEQAHELRELEREQMKSSSGGLAHGNPHDSATLMALVQKLAGDSSDLSMSAPSNIE